MSLLAFLSLFLSLLAGFLTLASRKQPPPVRLDPLCALGQQLHLLPQLLLFLLDHSLNLLSLASFLLPVVPLLLKLLQLVIPLLVLLLTLVQI